MNLRTPTGQDPEPCAFDQAWQPTHATPSRFCGIVINLRERVPEAFPRKFHIPGLHGSVVFEKREVRVIAGVHRESLWPKSWEWWGRAGFHLAQSGPYRLNGSSFYSRIGLKREIELSLDDVPGGCSLDLRVNAQITDEGAVLGGISAIVFWPVAVVGGAVSYTQYEDDARNLMIAFWQYASALAAPGAGTPPRVPAVPPPCTGCGAALLPDWKVCPYCGRAVAGPP